MRGAWTVAGCCISVDFYGHCCPPGLGPEIQTAAVDPVEVLEAGEEASSCLTVAAAGSVVQLCFLTPCRSSSDPPQV